MTKDSLIPKGKWKVVDIAPLAVSGIPSPWNAAIDKLQTARSMWLSQMADGDKEFASLINGMFTASYYWMYKKKWNKRFKLPFPSNVSKPAEPLGDLFLSTLNLCEALHTLGHGSQYRNAGEWFFAVAFDIENLVIERSFVDNSSRSDLEFIRPLVKKYRDCRNPHDNLKHPHLWSLVETTLEVQIKGKSPDLLRRFWMGGTKETPGFIRAWSAYATFLDHQKGLQRCYLKNGEILARVPKNSGKDEVIFRSKNHALKPVL